MNSSRSKKRIHTGRTNSTPSNSFTDDASGPILYSYRSQKSDQSARRENMASLRNSSTHSTNSNAFHDHSTSDRSQRGLLDSIDHSLEGGGLFSPLSYRSQVLYVSL